MRHRLPFLALLAAIMTVPASAQQIQLSRPDRDGPPTPVEIKVAIIELLDIKDADEAFDVDFVLQATWKDERMAWDVEAHPDASTLNYGTDEIWHPRILIINEKDLDVRLPDVVEVAPDGTAIWTQRYQGLLTTPLEMRAFPSDRQRLPIRVVAGTNSESEIELVADIDSILVVQDAPLSGWWLEIGEPKVGLLEVENAALTMPEVVFYIEAQRDAWYFVWTMMLPLTLIVFMAWMVFWIDPSLLPPQVGISTAAVFSMIAYRTALRVTLPKVSYLTKAEVFILGCTLMVFAALAHAVAVGRFAKTGREELAHRMDQIGRWVYVAAYVVVLVVAIYW